MRLTPSLISRCERLSCCLATTTAVEEEEVGMNHFISLLVHMAASLQDCPLFYSIFYSLTTSRGLMHMDVMLPPSDREAVI